MEPLLSLLFTPLLPPEREQTRLNLFDLKLIPANLQNHPAMS